MRTYLLSLCVLMVMANVRAQEPFKTDTTWFRTVPDEAYTKVKRKGVRYKVTKTNGRILFVHIYNADHTLASEYELNEKQIEDRKAEGITHLPNGKTRRVVSEWDMDLKRSKSSFYNQSDELIGTAIYSGVGFNGVTRFVSGTQVSYYHQAGYKQIKTRQKNDIIEEKNYYKNGQLAEHYTLSKNLKHGTSVFYNPKGEEVGRMEYSYNLKRHQKREKQGVKYTYNTEELLTKTVIEGVNIKEEIFFVDQKSESVLYVGNTLFEGVHYTFKLHGQKVRTVYKDGNKIEETTYSKDGTVQSYYKDLKRVYYTHTGDTIGVCTYFVKKKKNIKEHTGKHVKYGINHTIKEVHHFKDGKMVKRDKYQITPDWTSSFRIESNITTQEGKRYQLFYYSTGQPKSKKERIKSQDVFTTFNTQGDTLGVFKANEKDGTKYSFFGSMGYRDYLSKVETYNKGKLEYFKKWYFPKGEITSQDDLQLIYDYNYKGEAKTYHPNGELMYTMQMQNQKPWSGQWEEHQRYGGADIMYTYADGVKQGEYISYGRFNRKRRIAETGYMESGKRVGVSKFYRQNRLYKTEECKAYKQHGTILYYDKDGKVWKEEIYDQFITKETEYDKKGKVVRTLDYKRGKPYDGISEKDNDYKTKSYLYTATKYVEGKKMKTYKSYNSKVFEITGKPDGNLKPFVIFNAETEKRYADITWNRHKANKTDSVTYYNRKETPFLLGQFRENTVLSGHIIMQAFSKDLELNLIHIVKHGDEVTMNVFDSQTNLIMSNYMANSSGIQAYLKTHYDRDFKIQLKRFKLNTSFQKFVRSRKFLKTYVGKYNGGLE